MVGGLVYEVEELVELGGDDDLGAAVALATEVGCVVGDGVKFAAASGCQTLGIHAKLVL